VQTAVDTQHHLIVAHDVTNVGHDRDQLSNMAGQAKAAMGIEALDVVMIAPVNQDDVDWGIAQVLDQVQTSETTTHYHHALPLRGRYGGLDRWSHLRAVV
jgi:hypothetical protein